MFKIFVNYPTFDEELEIVRRTTSIETNNIQPVLEADEIIYLQKLVRQVPASEHVLRYTLSLVRQTRVDQKKGIPEYVQECVTWGAGPRAVQYLILGGKARALLNGRTYVTCEDIQKLAKPVLRHRLVMSFLAESENLTSDTLIDKLIEITPISEDELTRDPRFQSLFAS
jgi:MoxR-like ATPase